jgi:cyclase
MRILNLKQVDEVLLISIRSELDYLFIKEIVQEAFMPISYCGGVKRLEDFKTLFSLGVDKVYVNRLFLDNPEVIEEAINIYGSQSIGLVLDIKFDVWGKPWHWSYKKRKSISPIDNTYLERINQLNFGEICLSDVFRDGTMQGLRVTNLNSIIEEFNVPVIVNGGLSSFSEAKSYFDNDIFTAIGCGSVVCYSDESKQVLINYTNYDRL